MGTTAPWLSYGGRHCVLPIAGMTALEVSNVSAAYDGAPTLALEAVSISVPLGASIALVGHNGSGKSTMLKAIAGLLPISSGHIRIFGQLPGACHHRVAYLPQRGEVDWRFPINVRKLVLTGRYVHLGWLKRPRAEDFLIVEQALDRLGLSSLAERQIGQLSGGQQQRVLLARALAQESDLLLLDEPLNAVDADTRETVANVLLNLKSQGKAMLVATHDLGRLEADFDGALYLHQGHEIEPPPGSFSGIRVGKERILQ